MPDITLLSSPHISSIETFERAIGKSWRIDKDATDSELLIEYCGRVCYLSFGENQSPKNNRQYIRNLIDQGHESVLEHATWSFLATNITRSFTHQLVRHRVGFSFSQLSQQYADQSDTPYTKIDQMDLPPEKRAHWIQIRDELHAFYQELITDASMENEKEMRRRRYSAARLVLPNDLNTVVAFSANARSLRHFLTIRGGIVGDLEMRRFSASLLDLISGEAPAVFEDFSTEYDDEGEPIVIKDLSPRS